MWRWKRVSSIFRSVLVTLSDAASPVLSAGSAGCGVVGLVVGSTCEVPILDRRSKIGSTCEVTCASESCLVLGAMSIVSVALSFPLPRAVPSEDSRLQSTCQWSPLQK